jgi:unsaturated rhamnogalacturonyl hydrolase
MTIKKALEVPLSISAALGLLGCTFQTDPARDGAVVTESRQMAVAKDDPGGCPLVVPHTDTLAVKLADSLMASYPAYMDYETGVVKKGWEYTNGVLLYGFLKLYAATRDIKYLDYVKPYVDRYVQADGTILYLQGDPTKTRDPRILDVLQPSSLLFALYQNDPSSSQYLAAMKNTRNVFPTIQTNSLGGYFHKPTYPYQMWLDGLYMAQPFLTRFGSLHADSFDPTGADRDACHDTAAYQLTLIAEKTQDPAKNLYYHAWLDWDGINAYNAANPTKIVPPAWANPVTGASPEVWSRALGWYSMALVDVLDYLPPQHEMRREVVGIVRNLAVGLARYQDQATGLWSQVVDKGGQPGNFFETSGSAMFVYALAKAARSGYIPGVFYKVAEKGWEGIKSRVVFNDDGTFKVQGTVGGMSVLNNYNAYVSVSVVDNAPQGIAAVLLASTAIEIDPSGCQRGRSAP